MSKPRLSAKSLLRWLFRVPPRANELLARLPSPRTDEWGNITWTASLPCQQFGIAWQLSGVEVREHALDRLSHALPSLPAGVEVLLGSLSTPIYEAETEPATFDSRVDLAPRAHGGVASIEHQTWLLLRANQDDIFRRCWHEWRALLAGLGFVPVDVAPGELSALWAASLADAMPGEAHLHLEPTPGACAPAWPNGAFGKHSAQTWTYVRWSRQDDKVSRREVFLAHQQAHSPLSMNKAKSKRADVLWQAMADGEGLVRPTMGCVVRAANPEVLRLAVEHQRQLWQEHGVRSQLVSPKDRRRRLAALPWVLTARELQALRSPVLTTRELVELLPLRTSPFVRRTSSQGLPLRTLDGELLRFDPHTPDSCGTLILGSAGSGCSFVSNALLSSHLSGGGTAWALRWGRSPVFDEVHQAQTVELVPDAPISLNPMSLLSNETDFFDALPVLRAWLCSLATGPHGDLAGDLAEEALFRTWKTRGQQSGLSEVLEHLRGLGVQGARLAVDLQTNLSALGLAWFEGDCKLPLTSPYLSFDPSAFAPSKEEALISRTLLALHGVALQVLGLGRRSMLLVDEAAVMGDFGAGRLMAQCMRAARLRGCAIVWTEHPFPSERAHQREHEAVLADYCNNVIVLHGSLEYTQGWARRLTGDERWTRFSRTTRSHSSFLLSQGQRAGIVELELSPQATAVMKSWMPKDLAVFRERLAKGQTPLEALEEQLPG